MVEQKLFKNNSLATEVTENTEKIKSENRFFQIPGVENHAAHPDNLNDSGFSSVNSVSSVAKFLKGY